MDNDAQSTLTGSQSAAAGSQSILGTEQAASQTDAQAGTAVDAAGQSGARLDAATEYSKFSVPEGFNYDDGKVDEFSALARELNLTQEQAQKLVDLHVKHWLGFEEQARLQAEEWGKQTMNDPEFGGQKFTGSLQDANRFINAFGGASLRAALDATGAGNHPEVFKAFARAGRILGEDRLATGAAAVGQRGGTFADLANSMYPSMKGSD